MDTAAPVEAASRFTDIVEAVRAYIDTAKAAAADGITWAEFGELLVSLLRLAVRLADLLQVSGSTKKGIVLEAVRVLFDTLADKCVPIWLWPIWGLCRSAVKALVLALASGAIESLLPLVRST